MCTNVPVNTTDPNLDALTTGDALSVLTAYDKFDVTNLYTVTEKSETTNLMKATGTAYVPETCLNNVLIVPKMNVTNALINNLLTHTETEPIIIVLNTQPWFVENNATSVLR